MPWSLVRLLGHPNLEIIFSKMNLVFVSIVQSFTSVAFSHLVRYSIVVIMYRARECLASGEIGPMKSTSHLSKI